MRLYRCYTILIAADHGTASLNIETSSNESKILETLRYHDHKSNYSYLDRK